MSKQFVNTLHECLQKFIYVFNLCSKVKFNKSNKKLDIFRTTAICTVSCDTLDGYICPTAKPQCQILLKALICSKRTARTFSAIIGSEDTCCPRSLWCLQCCYWHSDGCRTSWVCLQHHAAVVTSNGVTVVAASFHLPSVSTANINTVQYTKS